MKNISKVILILYLAKLWKVEKLNDSTLLLRNKNDIWTPTKDWEIVEDVTPMHYIQKRVGKNVLGIDGNIAGEKKDRTKGEFVEKHQCRI